VLALTDQGLAHLVIAAGRVPREQRAARLRDVAHRIETAPKRAADHGGAHVGSERATA